MGSSQVHRDNSGRINLSIIPQSHRSSSMAGGGSISPSSLHDTTIYSTSSQQASPVKTAAPAEVFGQLLSEDTIPVPREQTSQNPLRSTPPKIPESLILPAGLPEMGDFSANINLSAEQVEEITRPPRPSSEAPIHHSEPQVIDREVIESPETESGEEDSDWEPPTNKKGNQNKRQAGTSTKSISTRKSVTSKVVKTRTSQASKRFTASSTSNKCSNNKNFGVSQPDDKFDETSQATLPLNSNINNAAPKSKSLEAPLTKLPEKEKPVKKAAARIPKKSFFDDQKLAKSDQDTKSGEPASSKKAIQATKSNGDNTSKSVSASRKSYPGEKQVPANDRPKANQGSSRTVKGTAQTEVKVSGIPEEHKGKSRGLLVPPTEIDKPTSAIKTASSSSKVAPVALRGWNQKRRRSPTYGSTKRSFRVAAKRGPEIESGLATDRLQRVINTTSEKEVKTTKDLTPSAQKQSRSARSRRSANLSVHSAGPSEILSDPISDDIDTSIHTSDNPYTKKKRLLNVSHSNQTKPSPDKCLEVTHKSPEPQMNERLDVTMDIDTEPVFDDMVFSDYEAESSPIEAPSMLAQVSTQAKSTKGVCRNQDKHNVLPSQDLPLEKPMRTTNRTQPTPLMDDIGAPNPVEERSSLKKSSIERHPPASSSSRLHRKRSIVSESGSPLEPRKRSTFHVHDNSKAEEKDLSVTRQQAMPLPSHQPMLNIKQAPNKDDHSYMVPTAAVIPELKYQPREIEETLLDHLVRRLRAEPSRVNHPTSTTEPSAQPNKPALLFGSEHDPSTNKQPAMHNYQSTIEFINKVAAMDHEAHLDDTHVKRDTEIPRTDPDLQRDIWHRRTAASHELEAATETSKFKTLRELRAPAKPQARDPTIRHRSNEWAKWQDAVDKASDGVVDILHNVTVEMLLHMRSKETSVTGVIDEYKNNGKRVISALVKKQNHERHEAAIALHQQAMNFNQEFEGLASDDKMDDKIPARGRRISRYDDWQKEVKKARNRIRDLRS